MQTVVMPNWVRTMEEGKILRRLKQEGEEVKKGDALAEIETEKVNIQVESFSAGTLRKIRAGGRDYGSRRADCSGRSG